MMAAKKQIRKRGDTRQREQVHGERKERPMGAEGIPLLFVLAVVPLLTMMGVYQSGIGDYAWGSGNAFYDFFLLYKSHSLMLTGAVIWVFLLYFAYLERRELQTGVAGQKVFYGKGRRCVVTLAVLFLLLSFVSALAADERRDAFLGGYEQMEGVFVLTAYIACFLFACLYVTGEKGIRLLLRGLLIGSFVLSLLGALQVVGVDYLTSKATLPFFTMFMNHPLKNFEGISASFGKGIAYATLYNPNYVGTYVALVLPVTVLLCGWERKPAFRILALFSSVFQLIMLAGSQSMAGLMGVAAAALCALVFFLTNAKKRRWLSGAILVMCLVLTVAGCFFVPGILRHFTSSTIDRCSYRISSMVTEADSLRIELDSGRTVTLTWQPGADIYDFAAQDEEGNTLTLTGDAFNGVGIQGELYRDLEMTAAKTELELEDQSVYQDVLRLTAEGTYTWDFVRIEGRLWYINRVGKRDQLRRVEADGFSGHYDFATNRGYIWSRTIPLLKDTLLLGAGPDNFVYAFPNDDYVGKINCGFDRQIVTKPHNLYMQIWVQDGMPACLAFVALYLIFAIYTFRRCFLKRGISSMQKAAVAIFCGVTGYMVTGLANDSTICVAPVFWILLGLGYSLVWREHHSSQ